MAGMVQGATLLEQQMTRKAAQKQAKLAEATATATEELLRELIHEQRQGNKMLWLLLSDTQRAQFQQMP